MIGLRTIRRNAMNPAKLMLSAALASLMLFTPAVFTTADAAGIKIKPQIVKVRPKIKIAKPKVRVKVRAAKVRIKPKVKVKVRTTKIQIKPKVKVKVRAANVKMKPKVQLPAVQLTQRPKVVKPKTQISQTANAALNDAATNSHSRGAGKPLLDALKCRRCGTRPRHEPGRYRPLDVTQKVTSSVPEASVNGKVNQPTKPRNTPTLVVPGGFMDAFDASGGVFNNEFKHANDLDAVRGARAARDLLGSGFGTGELPTGSDGIGRQRIGGNPDGMLSNPSDAVSDPGHAASAPWTTKYSYRVGDTVGSVSSNGTNTQDVSHQGNGTTTVETTDGSRTSTDVYGPVSDKGTRTIVSVEEDEGSMTITIEEDVPVADASTTDGGDGGSQTDGGSQAGNTGDGSWSYSVGGKNAGKWSPFGGYVSPSHTFFDTISQPDTDGQVTVTGSARPNAGPGAVTNGGDGGFVAGGNTGGSGGFGHDPCATVIGCGDGPGGAGPEGTVPDRG